MILDVASERAVISAAVMVELARPILFSRLDEGQFGHGPARVMFRVLRERWITGAPIIPAELAKENGVRVAEFVSPPTSANLDHYIGKVEEYAERRRLAEGAEELRKTVTDGRVWEVDREKAMDKVLELAQGREPGEETLTGERLAAVTFERVQELHKNPMSMVGPPSGFGKLDYYTLGFDKPLTVLSGAPGQGKSALSLCMGIAAAKAGCKTLYITLENTREQTINRALSHLARVPGQNIRTGYYRDNGEYEAVQGAAYGLRDLPIVFSDERPRGIEQICGLVIKEKMVNGIGFAIIDYLGEVSARKDRGEKRWEMLGRYVQVLKELSQNPRVNIPILLVNQLQRGTLTADDVTMDDESGSMDIPRKAQLVLSLRRLHPGSKDEAWPRAYVLKVTKNRHGPDNVDIHLNFDGRIMRFEEAADV